MRKQKKINDNNEFWRVKTFFSENPLCRHTDCRMCNMSLQRRQLCTKQFVRVVAFVPDRNMDFNDRGKRTPFSPPSSINDKRILKILSSDSH